MAKQKSALQQALSAIGKAGGDLATQMSNKGKDLIKNKVNQADSAFAQIARLINGSPVPQGRVGKNAQPIATMTNGAVLYNDGSVKQTPTSSYLQNLRNSVFQQYAFTPQAQDFLSKVPLGYTNQENAYGQFSNWGFLEATGEGPGGILINPVVNGEDIKGYIPGQVMAHEMLHAVDDNLALGEYGWREPGTPYQQRGGNSFAFMENLRSRPNDNFKGIKDFVKFGYPDANKLHQDVEGFAQYGAEQGQNVLLEPFADAYKGVFVPMSKDIRQSFQYPVQPVYKQQNNIESRPSRNMIPGQMLGKVTTRVLNPKKLTSIRFEEDF